MFIMAPKLKLTENQKSKFLAEVVNRPILYDKREPNYKLVDVKIGAWDDVGAVMGWIDEDRGKKAQNVYLGIRRYFNKLSQKKSGQGADDIDYPSYMDAMKIILRRSNPSNSASFLDDDILSSVDNSGQEKSDKLVHSNELDVDVEMDHNLSIEILETPENCGEIVFGEESFNNSSIFNDSTQPQNRITQSRITKKKNSKEMVSPNQKKQRTLSIMDKIDEIMEEDDSENFLFAKMVKSKLDLIPNERNAERRECIRRVLEIIDLVLDRLNF